jgi:hypothetical protein
MDTLLIGEAGREPDNPGLPFAFMLSVTYACVSRSKSGASAGDRPSG